MTLRVVISAGEVSGDQHLGRVVRSLKALDPAVEVRGMGGKECREAGADLVVDCYRSGAAMGFWELLSSARKIFTSFRTMSSLIRTWKPDVVVLVDYPDFNLRLARVAHEAGCFVLYYIPPKMWAWRSGRVEKVKRYVDHVAAIFPFEREWYHEHGYDRVSYVGHPLVDENRGVVVQEAREPLVLLMPGSRNAEIERMLLPMLQAFERIRGKKPEVRAVVMLADNMSEEWAKQQAATVLAAETLGAIDWKRGNVVPEMQRARAGILKSGTCNLEGAIAGLPFVCTYSGTLLAKIIVKLIVRLKEYSPVNIMKAHTVREFIRVRHDPEQLERELVRVYEDGPARQKMLADLHDVRTRLFGVDAAGGSGETVAHRVAQLICKAQTNDRRVA